MFTNRLTGVLTRLQKKGSRRWFKLTGPRLVSAQTFSDHDFLAQFRIKKVSRFLQQGNISAAREALLAHYECRIKSGWSAFPPEITDLEIDLRELKREELIHLANSFVGQKVNWCLDTPDREQRWWFNRHSWWSVLALAYTETGDERYASTFVAQLLDWIESNPPPRQKNENSHAWRLMEIGLRMRTSWIPSFGLFYPSPAFTIEAKLKMLRSIYDHARFLFLFKTKRNHLLRESNGLIFVSAYFPEFAEAPLWQNEALARLDAELVTQVNEDGSQLEVSTGYQWLVIDEFQHAYDLLTAHNLSLPRQDLAVWLKKMYQVVAYLIRPDGTFPQINDGYIYFSRDRVARAGEDFGRDDFVYIGTGGSRGVCPEQTSIAFKDAGLYVMRSDWSPDAHYLLFDAGPYGGPHGHEDKLSFEISAFGQTFIVDPGSYTYSKLDPFRTYFIGSQGHNTVLVDGLSQVRRWNKSNLEPQTAPGNYGTWLSRPEFDYVAAMYKDGYGAFRLEKPAEATIVNDVIHTRRILFVKPDYWLILDELRASEPHRYQLLFHASPETTAEIDSRQSVILRSASNGASLALILAEPLDVEINCVTGSETPIQGWYSANSGHKVPATTVIYEWPNTVSKVIATLLYPYRTGSTADGVAIAPLTISGGQGHAFVVTTPWSVDYLMFSSDDNLKQFGPYSSRGLVAGFRTDKDEKVVSQFEALRSF